MDKETKLGPLATGDYCDNLEKQLKEMPKGYKIVYQREEMKKPFFPITVIEGTDQTWDQELFGPVFQLFKADSEEHAIKLANSGTFGLGGSVFSQSRGQKVLDQVRCGLGFVNCAPVSDPKFPSGGVYNSGYGRECGKECYR